MAIVRPFAVLLETAGGLLDSHHDKNPCGDYAVLLTITKVRKEREYRGVAVRQFAPLARVHAASGSGRNAVHPNLALFPGTGSGPAEQINDSILDRICRSPYPFTRLCEEVAQHCNIFINPQLFKRFSEPAGYMADFCHTSVRQLADFAAPECGARLLFWKNEKTIINIVVGSFGGAGGAAKLERRSLNVNFFQIGPIVELLFHLLSFFPVCRNVPEPCRNNFENSAAFFKNNPALGTKPVAGSFVLCRNVPEPCRNARDVSNIRQEYSPIGKQLKILRFL